MLPPQLSAAGVRFVCDDGTQLLPSAHSAALVPGAQSSVAWSKGIASLSVIAPKSGGSSDGATPPATPLASAPSLDEDSDSFELPVESPRTALSSPPPAYRPRRDSDASVASASTQSSAAWVAPEAWPFTRPDVELLEGVWVKPGCTVGGRLHVLS
jgi:hypothetical protein